MTEPIGPTLGVQLERARLRARERRLGRVVAQLASGSGPVTR